MKKQSTMYRSNRIRESETPTTQFPIQTLTETQPKGLHNRSKSTHLDAGAAESHTKPVTGVKPSSHSGSRKRV